MEQPNASLQLILTTDKRNPCFTLYQTEDGRFLHVYYGMERLEVGFPPPPIIPPIGCWLPGSTTPM